MPDKRKILVDSVRRLISLKVSDEEIVLHLKEVGVSSRTARQLIRLAKRPQGEKLPPKEEAEAPAAEPKEVAKAAATPAVAEGKKEEVQEPDNVAEMTDDISEQQGLSEENKKKFFARVEEKTRSNSVQSAGKAESTVETGGEEQKKERIEPTKTPIDYPKSQPIDLSKLWEKGILSAVDQRLKEMREIREDVDKAIAKKADEIAKKEVNKIQVLFDSQQKLFLEKVNTHLGNKGEEIEQIIDHKISELKATSTALRAEVNALEKKREEYREFTHEIDSQLGELNKVKNKLVTEMNSELIKAKSSIQEFLDSSKSKIGVMDDRVNKTLEVGSSVIEGLRADAEKTLRNMSVKRTDELNENLIQEIDEIKATKKGIEDKLEDRLNSFDKLQAAIQKEFDPTMFRQQMQDLEMFKQQFVKVIETNVDKFNQAIQRINQQAKTIEEQTNKRMRLIDRKIKGLNEFEEQFAKEMGLVVEKAFEKRKGRKKK